MLNLRGYLAILTIARGAEPTTNYAFALPASSVPN
jgi:hypothetical protein